MNKKTFAGSLTVLTLLLVGMIGSAVPVAAASGSTEPACTSLTVPFSVTGAIWGTTSSPVSVYPGAQDVPLTITMLFSGPCTSPVTDFTLPIAGAQNPTPFTGSGGVTSPENVDVSGITPNTLITETFYLDVAQSAGTGVTYNLPMVIQYENNTASSVLDQLTQAPVVLYGPVDLNFAASTTHLVAGAEDNVTVTITNSGSGTSGPVSTTVTAPSGVTLFNQLATTTALAPGGSATGVLEMFVASSLSGTAFTLTLTSKYLDAYSNSQTVAQTIGFTASTPTAQTGSSFLAEGANWGSATSTTSPLPGTQDTPLVVSLQYLSSTPVTSLQGALQLPAGITDLNGDGTAVAYSSATTNQYGAVQLTFYLDIADSVKPGSYNYTLDLTWMTAQSAGLAQTSVLTPPPIAPLQSTFQIQGASWTSGSSSSSSCLVSCTSSSTSATPIPGTQDAHMAVSMEYVGTTDVTSVTGSLSLPTGMTNLNGGQTATAYASAVSPNSVVTLTFEVNVGGSVAPGSYNYTLDLTWLTSISTSVSETLTESATVTPAPIAPPTTASFPLSLSQTNTTVSAGATTASSFVLTNAGTAAIYSPTFALTVGSPIVIASINAPVPTPQLDPGKTTTFVAQLTAGPSATEGLYSGTLAVTFTDSSGTSHSQSFPVLFTVEGTVILILQDTAVTQTTAGFTITGSILNEGSTPAYYASVSGLYSGKVATAVYMGEIDPDTPLPFSVTIPFTAPTTLSTTTSTTSSTASGNATTATSSRSFSVSFTRTGAPVGNFTGGFPRNGTSFAGFPGTAGSTGSAASGNAVELVLTLSYMDLFNVNHAQSFNVPATVKTASQLGGSGPVTVSKTAAGTSDVTYVAYGVVAAVIVTFVAGAVLLRRFRSKRLASMPQQDLEKSVI